MAAFVFVTVLCLGKRRGFIMRMIKPDVQSSVQNNEHFLSKAISPIPCCVAFFHLFLLDKKCLPT